MMQALKAGPDNAEVMLSLGVSHTNELDQAHALGHLHRWLSNHPTHGVLAKAAAASGTQIGPSLTGLSGLGHINA